MRLSRRRVVVLLLVAILASVSTGVVMAFFDILGVTDATVEISSLPNHAWDAVSGSHPADSIPTPSKVAGRAVASLILTFLKAVNWVI